MRRWSCSVTEISVYSTRISVTGREAFHITMPTEVQSTSSLKKKQAEDYYYLFFSFLVCIEKMLFQIFNGEVGGGGRISNAHSGSCALSAKMQSLHKVP